MEVKKSNGTALKNINKQKQKTKKMETKMELFNINSTKFLGGQDVHFALKLVLAGFVVYKLTKIG